MKRLCTILLLITLSYCLAESQDSSFIKQIHIGDNISEYISDMKNPELILCSSSQFYKCFTVNENGVEYKIAYYKNKVTAIFQSLILLDDVVYEAGKCTVSFIKEHNNDIYLFRDEGFGYILKIYDMSFIVTKDTSEPLFDDDIITMICRM